MSDENKIRVCIYNQICKQIELFELIKDKGIYNDG